MTGHLVANILVKSCVCFPHKSKTEPTDTVYKSKSMRLCAEVYACAVRCWRGLWGWRRARDVCMFLTFIMSIYIWSLYTVCCTICCTICWALHERETSLGAHIYDNDGERITEIEREWERERVRKRQRESPNTTQGHACTMSNKYLWNWLRVFTVTSGSNTQRHS